jgi:hypothetical protein
MATSASSSASSGPPPVRHCPCRLPYEDVKDACKANGFRCSAPWADDAEKICGKPLGTHPRESDLVPQAGKPPMMIVECRVNGPSHCPILYVFDWL